MKKLQSLLYKYIAWVMSLLKKIKSKFAKPAQLTVGAAPKIVEPVIKTSGFYSKLKNPGIDIKCATSVTIPPQGYMDVELDLRIDFSELECWSGSHYFFTQVYPGIVTFTPILESNPPNTVYKARIYNYDRMEKVVSQGVILALLCRLPDPIFAKRSGNL